MFERYTEKARRVIFFARYEASHYGSPEIDTEHLLLGLLREEKNVPRWLPRVQLEIIRQRIEMVTEKRKSIPTNVDLPLTSAAKSILKFAADEADRLANRHIGTEHLLLGFLDDKDCLAASLLREFGGDPAELRLKLAQQALGQSETTFRNEYLAQGYRSRTGEVVEIHGSLWNADYVRDCVSRCRAYNWNWRKTAWKPQDVMIEKKSGRFSFDLSLATDSQNFDLVQAGWKKDHCFICRWELFKSQEDARHGAGYTNGRDWLCDECYEKFWQRRDFIDGAYSDIT
jgi:hypothetical protein